MSFLKATAPVILTLATALTVNAEPAELPAGGSLRGRILDENNNPLPGAGIVIDDHRYAAVSDLDGYFTISNLPEGNHTVNVTYIGFAPASQTFTVKAGNIAGGNITLTPAVNILGEVVVSGVFSDQQKAINLQHTNMGNTNVVSADQISKFPDSNIGDALKRISGINVQYDQGEARFGQIRGTSADFSSVTINGNRLPSAEGDIRNVQLDLIPAEMMQTIEVSKTLTPDQDGDAIGGSINLITKSSPTHQVISATAGSGFNPISRKALLNLGFTYGNRFFNDRFGMMVSASYNNNPAGSYNTEFLWERDKEGNLYINDYQIRRYYVTRERQSYSLSLDYTFDNSNKIWFKGIFNNRNDWENRYRTTLKGLDEDGKGTVRVQTKAGSPDNRCARLERQRTMDFTLGGEHHAGIFGIDWRASYARASEERPNERYLDYQKKKQKFDIDLSNLREPFATPRDGSTMTLDDSFSLKELTEQQQDIHETDLKFALDFKTNLTAAASLKFGAKYVNKSKRKEIDFYEYTPLDENAFNADALAHLTDQNTSRFMPSAKYRPGLFVDKEFVGHIDLTDPSRFVAGQVAEELAGNYKAREQVTSGYARIDAKLSKGLGFMGGLRVENTALRYTGRNYDDETDQVTVTPAETSSYINFLPSLMLKWEPDKASVVRFGYNQAIARPKYSAIVPGMKISRSDNELTLGNPGLRATTSHNVDLEGEYYFKSIGLASLGLFYKRVEGFIVDEVAFNKEYAGTVWTRLTQPKNAGNANLFGFEASFQRSLDFITPALKCVGIYGTYTYTRSRVTDFNFTGRENEKGLRLPGSPENTANASIFFNKWGLNIRLSYNYASAFIDEMGASAFYDRYYDAVNYLDLNASYTFGRRVKCTVYADCTNLLNQPLRYYQGSRDLTMQAEYYGIKFNAGIKINL